MFFSDQRRQVLSKGIFSLWSAWAIGMGSIVLLIISAQLLTPKFVPVLAVLLEFVLLYLDRRNCESKRPACFKIPFIAQNVLFYTALLLVAVVFYLNKYEAHEFTGAPMNPDNPLIPILVTAPVTVIICLYFLLRRRHSDYCRTCAMQHGEAFTRGMLGRLSRRESTFQIRLLCILSLVVSIIVWGYYFTFFINVNINRADILFFIGAPVVIYILSLIYLGFRYYNIWIYYCVNEGMTRYISRNGTIIRYIVICGDRMLLTMPKAPKDVTDPLVDVPLKIVTPFQEKVLIHDVRRYFVDAASIQDFDLRPLYESQDPGMYNNEFHYVVYVDKPDPVAEHLDAQWFNLPEIDEMLRLGIVAPELVAEIRRIHTIAMAWKTYDKHGYRRYPIKHYKPNFNLHDMPKWEVDFNDNHWLHVAAMNQDTPLFTMRRLWRKLTKGIV